MRILFLFLFCSLYLSCVRDTVQSSLDDLSGEWRFALDSSDAGISEKWYNSVLNDQVTLPGSTTTNDKGYDVDINTTWTGSIFDSTYFTDDAYAKYREPDNFKIPFWLQPVKSYVGAAWYQKEITIPEEGYEHGAELFIERCHWESTVWIDSILVGSENSLATPHRFFLQTALKPGKHIITIRVDNRVKDIEVGENAHSISDHTQTNWNGIIGEISLKPMAALMVENVRIHPDVNNQTVTIHTTVMNRGEASQAKVSFLAQAPDGKNLREMTKTAELTNGRNKLSYTYALGEDVELWDEHQPKLYRMLTRVSIGDQTIDQEDTFGMREVRVDGTSMLVNNKPIFLRGTLESGIFPLTGYPPTDVESWKEVMQTCKDFGLNHLRFHSWCPPKAAFTAADELGMYLQVECSSWANQGATIGDGKSLDEYVIRESERIVETYGNHPSFLMMAYGNEPAGKNHVSFLTKFVVDWKQKDNRRLYTTAGGWPAVAENDFNNIPEPRIQSWGEGLKSIINSEKPRSDYDWSDKIEKYAIPTVSHEIGQWCVYPDFKEIESYTGVLKARNFEIFQERLETNGMGQLAEDFLLASGKLQALCYKADIEAALRTPGFGGFQLLDLHDFPGQGTALVGVLNPFWKEKGYIDAATYSQFCNTTVPLARFPQFTYMNNSAFSVPVEIAHFGATDIMDEEVHWHIFHEDGQEYRKGKFGKKSFKIGNNQRAGVVQTSLTEVKKAEKMRLSIEIAGFKNEWDFYVYPHDIDVYDTKIYVTNQFNSKAEKILADGGTVVYSIKPGSLKDEFGGDIAIGFSSIFWNTAWTNGQPPETLGILCDPKHPALADFPTDYHSSWQWWDPVTHSNAMRLDKINPAIKPIVRVIDDWVTARPLGLVFEARVGKGKVIVSSIDLINDIQNRPEAKQLRYSLQSYALSNGFKPQVELEVSKIAMWAK